MRLTNSSTENLRTMYTNTLYFYTHTENVSLSNAGEQGEGIRNLFRACLLRESICYRDAVAVIGGSSAKKGGYVSWPGGPRFVLQALVVGLDLVLVHPNLDLAWKRYVHARIGCEWLVQRAEQQNAQSGIRA